MSNYLPNTTGEQTHIIRVVVADDHPIVRAGITGELSSQPDIQVVGGAVNGDDTLDMVRMLNPEVLVLDINMPGLPVLDLLAQILPLPTQVLILTAYDDLEYALATLKAGAKGYLLKDENPTTINAAVRTVAQGQMWISAPVMARVVGHTVHQGPRSDGSDLSTRELEVLRLLADGINNLEIADKLGLSERTVRFHLRNIYDKLGVQRRGEAIVWAVRNRPPVP